MGATSAVRIQFTHKVLILESWPETGSNRRRRLFQGPLPMDLSKHERLTAFVGMRKATEKERGGRW